MSNQHHFVVYGVRDDAGTFRWVIDVDTTQAQLYGDVFDSDTNEWLNVGEDEVLEAENVMALDDLTRVLYGGAA